jgi:predicted MFS family arabinose efflux permease
MEGVLLEFVYICGPLVIVAGIGSWSTRIAMAACAAFLLAGDLTFAANPISRTWRPHPETARDLTGALRGPGVRVLIAVFVLCGLSVGAVEVAVPAALDTTGHRELTGVMLGLWGVGSMIAGLAIGRLGAATNAPRRLAIVLAAWGLGHAAVGVSGNPFVLGLILLVAGATIAPTFVSANGMLDDLAPTGTITEAFTWTSTGIAVGIAAGSTIAGALVEASSPAIASAVLGAGAVLASLVVRATAAGPLRAPAPAPA